MLGLILFTGSEAWGDVLGRLHFRVRDAKDERPIEKAKITLRDSANVHPPITLTTDKDGSVNTDPIAARAWRVTCEASNFTSDKRDVTVAADTTTEVDILLEGASEEKVIRLTAPKNHVNPSDTGQGSKLTHDTVQKIPTNGGEPQNLAKTIRGNPGFVEDATGQVHPRGEHAATSIYIDNFRLPGAFQGRAGQMIAPTAIETFDIMTGAYAPEYGGETAAILNLSLRAGTINPFADFVAQGGSYKTIYGDLSFGGQGGQTYGQPNDSGKQARRFSYFFDVSSRQTSNSLEPPQPDRQEAHNFGNVITGFSHAEYHLSDRDQFTLSLNESPANTQIGNRTGLPDFYAPYGQGYGYGGHLSRADAQAQGIASQQDAGQDIWQRDANEFAVLGWRHAFDPTLTGFLSIGVVHTGLDVLNANPAVDLNNLPADNSIEFNPTIRRNAHALQIQGNLTKAKGAHTMKAGFGFDSQSGNESYQLIPASQLAADDLASIDSRFAIQNGHAPVIGEKRRGYYADAYAQDTFRVTSRFTVNYGLRLDAYKQDSDSNVDGGASTKNTISEALLSPRINMAYLLAPKTVARLSYNKLFITPPQAQGAVVGTQIKPEKLDQYELSVERQMAPGQVLKIAAYYKDIHDEIDTGLLVPGTQIGVFTSVNFDRSAVHGVELSYNLFQQGPTGWSGYLAMTNSIVRPGGLDSFGDPAPHFSDHDQTNAISLGGAYTWKDGYTAGANIEYGSGLGSSVLFDGGPRQPHTEVDLRLSSRPDLVAGRLGLQFDIENLFDSRERINFNSDFSGTRFQQGRRVLLSVTGKF